MIVWDKDGEGYMSDFMTKLIRVRKCDLYRWGGSAKYIDILLV